MNSWPAAPEGTGVDPATEIRTLRRDLRDLVAVLSLPVMWRGRSPERIVESLAEAITSLLRLDFVHIRLSGSEGGEPIERADGELASRGPAELRALVEAPGMIGGAVDGGSWEAAHAPRGANGRPLRLTRVRPGVDPDHWLVTAGCYRSDFPSDRDRYLLRVALDQAAVSVETVELYQQAQQASVAKSQFIATMSHELRTPLNAVLGYVDLLLLGVPETLPPGAESHVERIQASARHLLEAIDSILSFSRIEAGHEEVRREVVDLSALIGDSCRLVEPLARRKGLVLECALPASAVRVTTDSFRIRQVLFNLTSNAIKFTREGHVRVELDLPGDEVVIRVRDTGIGIPPSERQRVFEPFRQVEASLTREAGGTGLGLSVSRRLAELMGGSLEVESEVGAGSTFTLRLPGNVERNHEEAAAE